MAKTFVSYSRKNIDFVKRLTGALQEREMEFWVDWKGIPPTVDWMKEIQRAIEEAATFLFIISPDSIKSKVCKDELEIAVKNGKRLIPVVVKEIIWEEAPSELSHLNYIFFRESDDFDTALKNLFTAIHTDYAWVQAHSRLQVKALEWERGNKDNGFLLRGRDLEDAEQQISINATKDPRPTDLQREYVLKSRQETDKQRRTTITVLVFIILMLVGITTALVTPLIQEANAKNQARGDLISVSGGVVKIGTDDENLKAIGAIPSQEILVDAFQVGKYEVTNRQYKLCVTYGNCTVPLDQTDFQDIGKQDYPVVFVTLFQANNYCHWVGLRLLNEVEWERAARGPDGKPWPWEKSIPSPDFVNMPGLDDQPTSGAQPFDSNPGGISSEGVYNLVGNVAEWTSSYAYMGGDYEIKYWNGMPQDFEGMRFYSTRGGSWSNKIEYISKFNPDNGTVARIDLGFRCGVDIR